MKIKKTDNRYKAMQFLFERNILAKMNPEETPPNQNKRTNQEIADALANQLRNQPIIPADLTNGLLENLARTIRNPAPPPPQHTNIINRMQQMMQQGPGAMNLMDLMGMIEEATKSVDPYEPEFAERMPKNYISTIADYLKYEMVVHNFFKKAMYIPLITVLTSVPAMPIGLLLKNYDLAQSKEGGNYLSLVKCSDFHPSGSKETGFTIPSFDDIKVNLIGRHPIIDHLKFQGYCLAGGSVLNAICKEVSGTPSYFSYSNKKHKLTDMDFFPVIDIPSTVHPRDHESYIIKCSDVIYRDFLNEIKTYLLSTRNLAAECMELKFISRSSDCTTIILMGKKNSKQIIQFIHRSYTSQGELLAGFDLAPCQVLYDGHDVKMTRFGRMSILIGFIPVDISCASKSWKYRLQKYHRHRDFGLWFPGLSCSKVMEFMDAYKSVPIKRVDASTKPKLSINDRRKRGSESNQRKIHFDSVGFILRSGVRNSFRYNISSNDELNNDKTEIAHQFFESDYGSALESVNDGEALAISNLRHLWNSQSVSVGCADIDRFLRNDFHQASIGNYFRSVTAYAVNFTIPKFYQVFDYDGVNPSLANEALESVRDEDYDRFAKTVLATISYLDGKVDRQIAVLKQGVKWRVRDPGTQISGTFNPIKLTAQTFYPSVMIKDKLTSLYNGFNLTINWEIKRLLAIAYYKKDYQCPMSMLPLDIVKLLFRILDWEFVRNVICELDTFESESQETSSAESKNRARGTGDFLGNLIKSIGASGQGAGLFP